MSDLQAVIDFILAYKWYAGLLAIDILAFWLIRAYGGGILKALEKAVEKDGVRLIKQVDLSDAK